MLIYHNIIISYLSSRYVGIDINKLVDNSENINKPNDKNELKIQQNNDNYVSIKQKIEEILFKYIHAK